MQYLLLPFSIKFPFQSPVWVADVDFAQDREHLVFLDTNGNTIADRQGKPILGDSGIAATGFKPQLDKIFETYLNGGSVRDTGESAPLRPLTLPTNPDVVVAQYFADDPNILVLGTASKDGFDSLEKKAQLPREAAEALLRNGVENAVAIGFRAPDTQAAVNIWLNSRTVGLEAKPEKPLPQIPLEGPNNVGTQLRVDQLVSSEDFRLPNNTDSTDQSELFLSSLLAYNLGTQFNLDSKFTGGVRFNIRQDPQTSEFLVAYEGGLGGVEAQQGLSSEFLSNIITATSDKYFQRYAINILRNRRGDPKLGVIIGFRNGKIEIKNTYAQAV